MFSDPDDDVAIGRRIVAFKRNEASFRGTENEFADLAPTASSATIGFPFGVRSAWSVCTIRSFALRGSVLDQMETTFPMTRASCIKLDLTPVMRKLR